MKKLLAALAVLTFSVVAHAADRTGSFALGYQSSFSGAGAWSVKYGMSSNSTLQGTLGFGVLKGGSNENFNFGARFLFDLAEAENSDFYTGLGVTYNWLATGSPAATVGAAGDDFISVQVPLGFEFSLANVPAIGFSAEMGAVFNYATQGGKNWNFGSVGGGTGAVFTAGAHYYF